MKDTYSDEDSRKTEERCWSQPAVPRKTNLKTVSYLARPRSRTFMYETVYADWQIEVANEIRIIRKWRIVVATDGSDFLSIQEHAWVTLGGVVNVVMYFKITQINSFNCSGLQIVSDLSRRCVWSDIVAAALGGTTLCSKSKISLIFNVPYVIAKDVQSCFFANIMQPNETHCSCQINCQFFIEFCGGSWIKKLGRCGS